MSSGFKLGKKGFVQDIVMVIIFLFIFAMVTYFSLVIWNNFRDKSASSMEDTLVVREINDNIVRTFNIMDYMFLILFGGLLISTIVTAFFIRTHPVLFILTLIMLFTVLILAVTFSNVFERIQDQPSMQNATDTYTIIPEIMDNYPLYIFGFFILVALAFFAKAKFEGAGL